MPPSYPSPADELAHVFPGDGEMARRMRAFDWPSTPLGPVTGWPESLCSMVAHLLRSRAQIVLYYGPALTTLYNDAYRPVYGAKHPQALGQPVAESWRELWTEGALKTLFERVIETGETFWASDRPFYLERHGFLEETYFDVSYDPVPDGDGRIAGVFCIVTETTGRVIGERRLRTLRAVAAEAVAPTSVVEACTTTAALLDTSPQDVPFALVYLMDETGQATLAASTRTVAGSPAAPPTVDLLATGAADDAWPFQRVLSAGRPIVVDDVVRRFGTLSGGAWPEAPHTAVVLPLDLIGQDHPAGFLVVGVSPRLALDDQYAGFFDLLATQISSAIANARRVEEGRRRARALEELDRAKTAFFSNVSHEFRTPLTLMLGPLEDALRAGGMPDDQRARLEVTHRNGLRLLKLVNTLLDFSRIEAGRADATFDATDVGTLTAEVASAFRATIERAGLALVVEHHPGTEPVYVDRDLWEKIVLNLVSNAFKFTLAGRITVAVKARPGWVDLVVSDTGIGIPADELPHVFERFHRVRGTQGRTHEGSGIGLALVSELVALHGGRVAVVSTPGQGSAFTVTIPTGAAHLDPERLGAKRRLASTAVGATPYVEEALRWLPDTDEPALPAASTASDETTRKRGARIVLADDNADMRDYVAKLLRPYWHVETVPDGAAALAAVRRERPDLVLSDVMMPELDGIALVQAIRADPTLRAIPVILLSARAGEDARVEGLEVGADDYLVKPFSARELVVRVQTHLEMAHVRAEALRDQERAAVQLRREEARYRALVEATSAIVWHADASGSVVGASRWTEITGQPHDEMLGMGWLEMIHPDDRASTVGLLAEGMRDKRGGTTEHRVRRADGAYRWMRVTAVPIFDAAGDVEEWIGMVADIDAAKRAEEKLLESEGRFRAMANVAPVMMWLTDANDVCTYVNDPWYAFTGQSPGAGLGSGWLEAIHPDDRRGVSRTFHAASTARQAFQHEFRLRRADGEYRWALVAAGPYFGADGTYLGYIGSVIDITDRKRIEAERETLLAAAERGRAAAEGANQAKDDFLAVLSHELRAPMNAMVGWLRILKTAAGRGDPALTERALATLERNIWTQAQVIDDLLDVSRIMSGKLELERVPVDLNSVVTGCVESLRPSAEAKHVALRLELGPEQAELVGDGARLQQVVANLVGNAIKFTSAGGTVSVVVERPDGVATITVSDTGQGIAPEFLPHIFDRFRQADSKTARAHGGLGLGLAIVKHLVTLHGGEVEVESAGLGQGARFRVTLPVTTPNRIELQPRGVGPTPGTPIGALDVLVVEDDPDSREALELMLEGSGARVRSAESVRQALDRYDARPPDVIISDIGMPGEDGYALVRAVREREEGTSHRTLVIAMTGFAARQDREAALRAGFDEHVAKPVDPHGLLARVRALEAARNLKS